MQVRTSDIYQGAYILTKGGCLDHLELTESRRGRPAVTFVFAGADVEEISREFESGRAMANVSIFRGFLDRLKDQMFTTLRENERGREDYDRKHETTNRLCREL